MSKSNKIIFEKSIASHEKAQFWSPKNNVSPKSVSITSSNKFKFDCPLCFHTFDISPRHIREGKFCSFCSNRRLCDDLNCDICFKKSFASHPKAKYWSNNNAISPREAFMFSGKKYIFDCKKCNHSFDMNLNEINRGRFCPFCATPPKKLCTNINCEICKLKSFASHPLAICWSPENNINPREVFKSAAKKYKFICNVCNHSFDIAPCTVSRGSFCGFCSKKRLCNNIDCDMCRNRSFASHPKAVCWSNKNSVSPRQVFKSSSDQYYFKCDKCHHTFLKMLHDFDETIFCRFCSNSKLCDNENCNHCYTRSFASVSFSKYWSQSNDLKPRQVLKNSSRKYMFDCPHCNNNYESIPRHITRGHWCPCVKNKTEFLLLKHLQSNFSVKITHQKKFSWCRCNRLLPFDFYIKDLNLIIEVDGAQHFKQVSNWIDPIVTQKRDLSKMRCANIRGISIIRIFQEHLYNNPTKWLAILDKYIKKYDTPVNIYLGNVYLGYPMLHNIDFPIEFVL